MTGYEGSAIESLYPSNTDMFHRRPKSRERLEGMCIHGRAIR